MTPEPTQDHSGLRWIRGELEETLRQARLQLEDFVEDEADSLDECVSHLHQVHGSLELVQVYGGAMLADELEKLARALNGDSIDKPDAAAEVLMLGLVQLPAYLERIESGQPDIPLILLPLMNDLRASRKAPLVSEISLFAPKLDSVIATEEVHPGSGNPALAGLVREQRANYHRGLLNWFRDVDSRLGLGQIRDVIERVSAEARTARMRRLLDASEALVAALQDDSLETSVAVKLLFGQLDRVFKRIIDNGEEAAARDFPLELLKNQLYYIARTNSDDPVVQAVRRSADLANSFPDISFDEARRGNLGSPGKALFAAVGDALRNDLLAVKDQLDLYIRGSRDDMQRLQELIDPIRRIGDTLGMVGRGELRSRLRPHCDRLQADVENAQPTDDEALMALAGDLLYIESALSGLAEVPPEQAVDEIEGEDTPLLQAMSAGEFREHVQAAVSQAFVELAKTKDAILQYLDDPQEPSLLGGIPGRLHGVSGALTILEQPVAAGLLEDLRIYVAELASGERELPNHEQREALADLVSGVEYHMESVVERKPDHQHALEVAQAASVRLGLSAAQPVAGVVDEEVAETSVWEETPVEPEQPQMASADKPALDDIDSEILDIFVEEAREEVEAIREHYPRWRNTPELQDDLTRVRRSFHTLKGSGRLVGASEIGEFAWSVENLLNRVIDGTVPASGDIFDLLDQVVDALPVLIDERESGVPQDTVDVAPMEERAFLLASAPVERVAEDDVAHPTLVEVGAESKPEEPEPEPEPEPVDSAGMQSPQLEDETTAEVAEDIGDVAAIDVEEIEVAALEPEADADEVAPAEVDGMDIVPEPVDEVPLADELDDQQVEGLSDEPVQGLELEDDGVLEELALGDLEEDLGLALDDDSDEIELTGEQIVLETDEDSLVVGADSSLTVESLLSEVDAVSDMVASELADETGDSSEDSQAVESILTPQSEEAPPIALDETLQEIFANETRTHLAVVESFIDNCRGLANGCAINDDLKRALHTLRGSANMAEVEPMASLAGALEIWANALAEHQLRTDVASIDLLERGHFVLSSLLQVINSPGASLPAWQPLQQEIEQQVEDLALRIEPAEEAEHVSHDAELVGIFMEEANEISENMEREFAGWQQRPDDLLPVTQLQRGLHTIKGGARLAGLMPVGDLSHAMESLFESITEQRITTGRTQQTLARDAMDALAAQIEALENGRSLPDPSGMVERLEAAARGDSWEPLPTPSEGAHAEAEMPSSQDGSQLDVSSEGSFELGGDSLEVETGADETPSEPVSEAEGSTLLTDSQLLTDSELLGDTSMLLSEAGDGGVGAVLQDDSRIIQFPSRGRHAQGEQEDEVVRRPPPAEDEAEPTSANRERVRVRAELLDQMVNNAGEVSIYRARLEQQNKIFGFNLDELAATIERLRGQLRSMELETEAQILSRYEREHEGETPAGFDPLEMDRYSTIQQLSRALSETVSDLGSIGVTLAEMNRDTDTLLLQQERVTNDLQDGLLRTRMVPVASRTARLQRVVRQTSHSLGKQAGLSILGGDGEMDRAILERMMAPLEHLLRNAVAHGIELPDERLAAEKPEAGVVSLVMSREGADVVLTVSDDGRGLDREAIRHKAIERGLLEKGAQIDDDDLDEMILEAGFTTAEAVSQISGRGVGMDVVLSEVKQLGGSLEIDSQPGRGSSFTIRLPFTLAITESLLVTSGDEVYAVPHSAMDGVVRISSADLEACYRGERDSFTYGGREYLVRYLGGMLGNARPVLAEGERWFPLLLVRSGEHRVAIHVDSLLGNRQIVVKSVGAQLSTVRWFTGGTILADGRIALILDINSLVRLDSAQHAPQLGEVAPEEVQSVKVMVVDDSITVRKVTSRLLERHNMAVITAKDGVDAVAVLQDEKPDVMLLDIEMPRMDGFELARHMRSIEELRHIPIIMITSRTGDKHRAHAGELGVKRYLGKPYQEAELLENIYTVLAESGDE